VLVVVLLVVAWLVLALLVPVWGLQWSAVLFAQEELRNCLRFDPHAVVDVRGAL
jgi:hypothetical protein